MGCLKLNYYYPERTEYRNTGAVEKQDLPLFFYVSQNGGFQYVYCAGNPIKYIDPDGREIYEFDTKGKYIGKSGEAGSPDQIRIIKADGSTVTSKEYANGTMKADFTKSVQQKDGTSVDVTFLKITGDQNAKESFEFAANNTEVEWSRTGVGNTEGKKGVNYLSSSQESGHEASAKHLASKGIRNHTHNHFNSSNPSEADNKWVNQLFDAYRRDIPTSIYHKGKDHPYDKNTFMLNNNINKGLKNLFESWRK